MSESTYLARFAHVFPKYQADAVWVRSFLEVFQRAGEDAMAKGHQAFVNLSKDRFTVEERAAAKKFSESLLYLIDPPLSLSPANGKAIQDLLRRALSG
jgi:hypothetical protein